MLSEIIAYRWILRTTGYCVWRTLCGTRCVAHAVWNTLCGPV